MVLIDLIIQSNLDLSVLVTILHVHISISLSVLAHGKKPSLPADIKIFLIFYNN